MKASLSLFILATVCGGGSSDSGLGHQGSSAGRGRRNNVFPGDKDTGSLFPDQIDQLNGVGSLDEIRRIPFNKTIKSPVVRRGILAGHAKSGVMPAKRARCKVLLQPFQLKKPDDPSESYRPSCVELEQCSGCCLDPLKSCQPAKTETISLNDCNRLQKYDPHHCLCKCRNAEDERTCKTDGNKEWDYNDCICRCREDHPEGCTTGLKFDHNTCACI